MIVRVVVVAVALIGGCWRALADSGTPEEQAACRPDVRRFCSDLPKGADDSDYLACLEAHRDALRAKCLAVLVDHGR